MSFAPIYTDIHTTKHYSSHALFLKMSSKGKVIADDKGKQRSTTMTKPDAIIRNPPACFSLSKTLLAN